MQYRNFGRIDWNVSALGFGAMRLPTKGLLHRVNWDASKDLIRYGIDKGINYLDTAWPYSFGSSEKIIGLALQDGYREKVFLVTKLPVMLMRKKEKFYEYYDLKVQVGHFVRMYEEVYSRIKKEELPDDEYWEQMFD